VFRERLSAAKREEAGRRWLFVPYDQLSDQIGPLRHEPPRHLGIVLVECPEKASRRPYHKQKLALVLANLRAFALEQAERGVAVRHVVSRGDYAHALAPLVGALGPLQVMEPAERELRADLEPLVRAGALSVIPHEGWLTTHDDFRAAGAGPPWRMDAFYRHVRRRTGILMDGGRYVGGKLSFDVDNRRAWRGWPPAPAPPTFPSSPLKDEVLDLVRDRFAHHPGDVDGDALPTTLADAEALWAWAKRACLPSFGPFEDAMSTRSSGLFHTRVAPLLNLHRLLPARVVRDVAALDVDLPSKEGFIRQVLGWREFVRHVHVATDGFRASPSVDPTASPSFLGAARPLPPAFWGAPSGLRCLDQVVGDVWREAYSHHITRLMVLSNLATLLDVSPRALTDWFWVAYADAYDWVVEPNVLGMGTFAVGDLMVTKPYVSGAAYIDRMSDYCAGCAFDPKTTCPITQLYWAFLRRHREALAKNPRVAVPLAALTKRDPERVAEDARVFEQVSSALERGERLCPSRGSLRPH
jgi:deoxyribodipyrimidine photolyase-related protein